MFSKIRHNILNRVVTPFIDNKKRAIIPDSQKLNSVFIIVEDGSKKSIKAIEDQMKALFGATHCHYIIMCQQLSDEILQSDKFCEVTAKDFGYWGLLKPSKKDLLGQLPACDMLINLTDNNNRTSDYISTILKTNFRVSFHKGCYSKIYDLILDFGRESDANTKIKTLHDYLHALNGQLE